jgi:hypothetical protein
LTSKGQNKIAVFVRAATPLASYQLTLDMVIGRGFVIARCIVDDESFQVLGTEP